MAGTQYYMSPEMFGRVLSPSGFMKGFGMKCDVWSLGIVLYQVLYGVSHFTNVLGNIFRDQTFSRNFDVAHADYNNLITKMLSVDPKTRPSSKEVKEIWDKM
jgi:serine/threonine protein kinase